MATSTTTHIDLDAALEDELLQFVRACEAEEERRLRSGEAAFPGPRTQAKLSHLYTGLQKIGFGVDSIEACLGNPLVSAQPAALDWLCKYSPPHRFPPGWVDDARAKVVDPSVLEEEAAAEQRALEEMEEEKNMAKVAAAEEEKRKAREVLKAQEEEAARQAAALEKKNKAADEKARLKAKAEEEQRKRLEAIQKQKEEEAAKKAAEEAARKEAIRQEKLAKEEARARAEEEKRLEEERVAAEEAARRKKFDTGAVADDESIDWDATSSDSSEAEKKKKKEKKEKKKEKKEKKDKKDKKEKKSKHAKDDDASSTEKKAKKEKKKDKKDKKEKKRRDVSSDEEPAPVNEKKGKKQKHVEVPAPLSDSEEEIERAGSVGLLPGAAEANPAPKGEKKKKKGNTKGANPLKQQHLQRKLEENKQRLERIAEGAGEADEAKPDGNAADRAAARLKEESLRWIGKTPCENLADYAHKHHLRVGYERQRRRDTDAKGDIRVLAVLITEPKHGPPTRSEYLPETPCPTEPEARELAATVALYRLLHPKNIPGYKSLPPVYREMWLEWAAEDAKGKNTEREMIDHRRTKFCATVSEEDKKRFRLAEKRGDAPGEGGDTGEPSGDACGKEKERFLLTAPLARGRGAADDASLTPFARDEPEVQAELGEAVASDEEDDEPSPEEEEVELSPDDRAERKAWLARVTPQREAYWADLPINCVKQNFLTFLKTQQCVVVSGETGCGKTTQIPRYILENAVLNTGASTANIVCCQPRRIAAHSVAERVAEELGCGMNSLVGYQFRGTRHVPARCRLMFCTTGILLRYLQTSPRLANITHVIVDEVHERTLTTDFLLQVLRQLLYVRKDLRVILMSATIDAEIYASYFRGAPILKAPGRLHPFSLDWLEDIVEYTRYSTRTKYYLLREEERTARRREALTGLRGRYSPETLDVLETLDDSVVNNELVEATLHYILDRYAESDGAILVFLPGIQEINGLHSHLRGKEPFSNPRRFKIICLHSMMAATEQGQAFRNPGRGVRKLILATNIAETSVTIPDVVFVIDTGRVKEMRYETMSKMRCLVNTAISKASARQRWGRSGRIQEGHVFALYPKTAYEAMRDHQAPEMLRAPLEDVCLQILSLGCVRSSVADFLKSSITPPNAEQVVGAMALLKEIDAVSEEERLTPLGEALASVPADVRLGKTLLMGSLLGCLDATVAIVASLSVKTPFLHNTGEKQTEFAAGGNSDHMAFPRVLKAWQAECSAGREMKFCMTHGVSDRSLRSIEEVGKELRRHLIQEKLVMEDPNAYVGKAGVIGAVLCAGLYPALLRGERAVKTTAYRWMSREGEVGLGKASVNNNAARLPSPYLVYNEKVRSHRVFVRETTAVPVMAVLLFGGKLIVNHADGSLIAGGWIRFTGRARTLCAVAAFRGKVHQYIDAQLLKREDKRAHIDEAHMRTLLLKLLAL